MLPPQQAKHVVERVRPDLFLTLFSVNYVTVCVINMLPIW